MNDDHDHDPTQGSLDLNSDGSDHPHLQLVEHDGDHEGGDGLEIDEQQSSEIQRIFSSTLPQYLQPVEEMIEELVGGRANAETIQALLSTLSSLGAAAARMGFDEAQDLLDRLAKRVTDLPAGDHPMPEGHREAVMADLDSVKQFAARIGGGSPQPPVERSPSIFQALQHLDEIDDGVLTRLSAAGLMTLQQLRMARPDEVAAVSGLDMEVVQRILGELGSAGQKAQDAVEVSEAPATAPAARSETSVDDPAELPVELLVDPSEASADAPADLSEASTDQSPLRAAARAKLEQQVEAEATLADIRAQMQRLTRRIQAGRAEADRLTQSCQGLRRDVDQITERVRVRGTELEQARASRQAQLQRIEQTKTTLQQQMGKRMALRQEQDNLSGAQADLDQQVGGLVEQVRRVQTRVALAGRRTSG